MNSTGEDNAPRIRKGLEKAIVTDIGDAKADEQLLERDRYWMRHALELAARGEAMNEVPVGAVIVRDDRILGEGFNQPISAQDPTAHAEIVALRQAAQEAGNYRLPGATLYVTLEPCTMCAGALIHARIERLVFGTPEPKAGAIASQNSLLDSGYLNHRVRYAGGVLAGECQHQLSDFFKRRRAQVRNARQLDSDIEG